MIATLKALHASSFSRIEINISLEALFNEISMNACSAPYFDPRSNLPSNRPVFFVYLCHTIGYFLSNIFEGLHHYLPRSWPLFWSFLIDANALRLLILLPFLIFLWFHSCLQSHFSNSCWSNGVSTPLPGLMFSSLNNGATCGLRASHSELSTESFNRVCGRCVRFFSWKSD